MLDVVIIGGSYAGLSAALALGRARRPVLVLDAGRPRNRFTPHAHNLLLHDGSAPADLATRARQQVLAYPTVQLLAAKATAATRQPDGTFTVETDQGSFRARRLLLATGMHDELPPVPGFAACWGRSVIHCPFCHGYEVADQPTGLWATGLDATHLLHLLPNWTRDLTWFTNGPATLTADTRALLAAHAVALEETPVAELLHDGGQLTALRLADGRQHPLPVLYARVPFRQASPLAGQLGCAFTEHGTVQTDAGQQTTVPGVYAAGDCANPMAQLAAAIGAGNLAGGRLAASLILPG